MIREATIEDKSQINNLGNLFIENFHNKFNLDSYICNDNYTILVNDENNVNAFLIVYKNIDYYEIEMIYVDNKVRNNGIATQLLTAFFENLLTNSVILLEVAVDNYNAIKLYKRFNFEVINIRKKYYNGIDAYVMKKVI